MITVPFECSDRRGKPAPYLERLMTPEDEAGLLEAVLDECERMDRVGAWGL
jgi:hypothetical protein